MLKINFSLPRLFSDGSRMLTTALTIPQGCLFGIVGPSGSGKSSILRTVAGLERPVTGELTWRDRIWFHSDSNTQLAPGYRSIGFLFQDNVLFSHMNVYQNIQFGFPGKTRGTHQTIQRWLGQMSLEGFESRSIASLSGGQQRRVSLARALARNPEVLLLDEPFSGLDDRTQEETYALIRSTHHAKKLTTLLATHSESIAKRMCDAYVTIDNGRHSPLKQTRDEPYSYPCDETAPSSP